MEERWLNSQGFLKLFHGTWLHFQTPIWVAPKPLTTPDLGDLISPSCVHICMCTPVCLHVYLCVYMYACVCVYVCEPVCVYTCIHVCLCVWAVLVSLSPEDTEEDNWSLNVSCKACIALKHQCKYSHKITLSVDSVKFSLILDLSESLRNRSLIVSTTELPRTNHTALCSIGSKRLDFTLCSYHKTNKTYATVKTGKGGFCRYWLNISLWWSWWC